MNAYWQNRRDAARNERERAAVAWDHLRTLVNGLPDHRRNAAWKAITQKLEELRRLDDSHAE